MARFDEVKETFWGEGAYGVQPPLTERTVREAEHELGVTLPPSLLDLLRKQNGGVVADSWNAAPAAEPTSWSQDHVPFDELMGIGRSEGTVSLLDTPYLVEEWGLPSPIALVSGDGHSWIALDYRRCGSDGEPSVTWFDTDLDAELQLAVDFRSFVEGLTSDKSFGGEEFSGAGGLS
ncbi:SMI1/KNR4 family protein [Streptomyces sp. NPDC087917]|uniref:SMI1/KNR4 family protein n=1 Tax=Streptomyces sp. NPDC087917 TaxID=3155060 RepID=UPI0034143002